MARDKNFFEPDSVRLVQFVSASEVIRGFRNGSLDAAALTLDEVLLLGESGIDLKIILVADVSHGGDVILGQSRILSMKDLIGTKVGVENTAVGALTLTRAFELYGLALDDITIVPLEADSHRSAFEAREIDAVVTFEPVRTILLNQGGRELFSSREIPGEIVDVLVVRSEVYLSHERHIASLINAWFQALDFMENDPSQAIASMDARLKIGPNNVRKSLQGLAFPDRDQNIQLLTGATPGLAKTMGSLESFMAARGLLQQEVGVEKFFLEQNVGHFLE